MLILFMKTRNAQSIIIYVVPNNAYIKIKIKLYDQLTTSTVIFCGVSLKN